MGGGGLNIIVVGGWLVICFTDEGYMKDGWYIYMYVYMCIYIFLYRE